MDGGQETRAPHALVQRLGVGRAARARDHHYESRQILIFAAQAVRKPGAERRTPSLLTAGLEESHGRVVIDSFSIERTNHAEFIHDARGVRKKFTQPDAAFPMLRELEEGGCDRKSFLIGGHASEPLAATDRLGKFFFEARAQVWLVIE